MAPRPCLECHTPSLNTRCPRCEATHQQARNQRRTHYQGDWPALSRQLRTQWVQANGWVCPGWHMAPHPSTDLVVDHVNQRSRTHLAILCRTCNSRKSATER
jgi:hypothetical protein